MTNPYAPPDIQPHERDARWVGDAPPRQMRLLIAWCILYLLNLPFCLVVGWDVTSDSGRVGMFVAIAVYLFLGMAAVAYWRPVIWRICVGAVPVALSQFFPMLQMFSGILALTAVGRMRSDSTGPELQSEFDGFLASIITGGILITVALGAGCIIVLVIHGYRRKRSP